MLFEPRRTLRLAMKLRNRLRSHLSRREWLIRPELTSELYWWHDNFLRHPWMVRAADPGTRANEFPSFLIEFIQARKRETGQQLHVLDVGSGPLSPLAWGVEQGMFSLVPIDPLAPAFISLLRKNCISYPVLPIRCSSEELESFFPKATFDIVYSRNALDHVMDLVVSLRNMSSVLRKGGYLCLEGFTREGTNTNWKGLHQHDLYIERGVLQCENRKGETTRLMPNIEFEHLLHHQSGDNPGDWFSVVFRKLAGS